jgi:hypothetical protein
MYLAVVVDLHSRAVVGCEAHECKRVGLGCADDGGLAA